MMLQKIAHEALINQIWKLNVSKEDCTGRMDSLLWSPLDTSAYCSTLRHCLEANQFSGQNFIRKGLTNFFTAHVIMHYGKACVNDLNEFNRLTFKSVCLLTKNEKHDWDSYKQVASDVHDRVAEYMVSMASSPAAAIFIIGMQLCQAAD